MPVETLIKSVRGETTIVSTNDSSVVRRLTGLGFEVGEKDGTTSYFEIPGEYVVLRKPKDTSGRAEMSEEQRGVTKARLTLARAAKNPEWAAKNAELVSKWAASHPEMATKYGISTNGAKPKASAKAKTSKAKDAPTPPAEEPKAEVKAGGLASRVKITR